MASYLHEFQKFDPDFYSPYRLVRGTDTLPFVATPELHNQDWLTSITTPEVSGFSANAFVLGGRDVNFFEWARGHVLSVTLGLNWRPSDQIRINSSYILQQYRRHSDQTIVGETRIPRLKIGPGVIPEVGLDVVAVLEHGPHEKRPADLVLDLEPGAFRADRVRVPLRHP